MPRGPSQATASAGVPRLIFPVLGATSYYDDFGAPRPSGRHQGNDLMADKRTPVVAVEAGRIVKYTRSSNAGCMLYLYGKSGTTYMYIHLNNDSHAPKRQPGRLQEQDRVRARARAPPVGARRAS